MFRVTSFGNTNEVISMASMNHFGEMPEYNNHGFSKPITFFREEKESEEEF